MGNAEKREKPEDRFFVKASQGTEFGYDDDLNDIVDFELEDPDSGVEGLRDCLLLLVVKL